MERPRRAERAGEAKTVVKLPSLLWEALEFAGTVAATTLVVCADVAANKLCASASSSSPHDTVDYLAMVELGAFDGFYISRVAHCASPLPQVGNILEHEFVVIETKGEGRVRYFSLEKVNRGAGNLSTIEMHEGTRISDVFSKSGADGPPRPSPRRRLELVPEVAVPLRRVLQHVFSHMDKPFSVHSHNCQDFAIELVDLIRLVASEPPAGAPVAHEPAADAQAPAAEPAAAAEVAFAFDAGHLPGEHGAAEAAAGEAVEAVVQAAVEAVVEATDTPRVHEVFPDAVVGAQMAASDATAGEAADEDGWEVITPGAQR